MIKTQKILTMFLFVLTLLVSREVALGEGLNIASKSQEEAIPTECQSARRIYKPRYSSAHRDFSYELVIGKVDVSGKTWGKYADVSLNMYNALDNSKLSTLSMSFGCNGGSMISCNVGFANENHENEKFDTVSVDIVTLDKAFNKASLLVGADPYVVILPRLHVRLKYVDWRKFPNSIQYNTEEKIAPSGGVPELWFLGRNSARGTWRGGGSIYVVSESRL